MNCFSPKERSFKVKKEKKIIIWISPILQWDLSLLYLMYIYIEMGVVHCSSIKMGSLFGFCSEREGIGQEKGFKDMKRRESKEKDELVFVSSSSSSLLCLLSLFLFTAFLFYLFIKYFFSTKLWRQIGIGGEEWENKEMFGKSQILTNMETNKHETPPPLTLSLTINLSTCQKSIPLKKTKFGYSCCVKIYFNIIITIYNIKISNLKFKSQ